MQHAEIIAARGKKVTQGILVCEIAEKGGHVFWKGMDERIVVHDERKNTAAVRQQKLNHGTSEEAGGTGNQVILIHHAFSFDKPTGVDYLS